MTTLASKIFRLPKQSFVVLFLFCTITLCLENKVKAQQPTPANTPLQSPTPSPTPTASLEERISKLEEQVQRPEGKPKDFWDKLNAVSDLISGLAIALVALLAAIFYRGREIKVSQVQTTTSLMPKLQSRYFKDVELAITLVIALGEVKFAMYLLEQRNKTGVAIPIFLKLLSNPNRKAAKQTEKFLSRYLKKFKLIEARKKLLEFAQEYEQTYKNEEYSPERTVKLGEIILYMKSYAPAAFPLLPQLLSLIKLKYEEKKKSIANFIEDKDEKKLIKYIKKINYEKYYDENLIQEIEYMKLKKRVEHKDMKKLKEDTVDWLDNGIRLAVVAIVQAQPSFYYLDWLAKLLAKEEDSFLGYHAAVALSKAVDMLKEYYSGELKTAIELAKNLGKAFYGDGILNKNSFQVLIQAEKKLEESTN
ncbi:MAG: hypothetical protein QNJ72_34460 [Pleurocapsa sp. MO_226.B13]|nr:hypothetical protein [Pleurocapsa sp. MO_226.B13]